MTTYIDALMVEQVITRMEEAVARMMVNLDAAFDKAFKRALAEFKTIEPELKSSEELQDPEIEETEAEIEDVKFEEAQGEVKVGAQAIVGTTQVQRNELTKSKKDGNLLVRMDNGHSDLGKQIIVDQVPCHDHEVPSKTFNIIDAYEKFDAIYSMIFVDEIFIVNDPYGFRLLVMGRRNNGVEAIETTMSLYYHQLQTFTVTYAELELTLFGLNVLFDIFSIDFFSHGNLQWLKDVGKDKFVMYTSCSFLCTVVHLVNEIKLNGEINYWVAVFSQKVVKINEFAEALNGQNDKAFFSANAAAQISKKLSLRVTNKTVQKEVVALKEMFIGLIIIINGSFIRKDQSRILTFYKITFPSTEGDESQKNIYDRCNDEVMRWIAFAKSSFKYSKAYYDGLNELKADLTPTSILLGIRFTLLEVGVRSWYSFKVAMKWDEDVFGLEYDLDLFNIVVVPDFNMGAMENKSMNIFNSKLVLVSLKTVSDADYAAILGVIGHEYFYNWTGNRVTCQNWFQLRLKEGLTILCDQEISSDMGSRTVKRIVDVSKLGHYQFPLGVGHMAQPIRPHSYIKMDNFYMVTDYENGAEVIKIYKTLLGTKGFQKGLDLYFKRHNGQAVTCEDFFAAMRDANDADFANFLFWYSLDGTLIVNITSSYNVDAHTFYLRFSQEVPPTLGQPIKEPMFIPVAIGLLDSSGKDMTLSSVYHDGTLQSVTSNNHPVFNIVLRVTKKEVEFVFSDIFKRPIPSLLRGYSAPIRLESDLFESDLFFLLPHDSDEFNCCKAGQLLARKLILSLVANSQQNELLALNPKIVQGFRSILFDTSLDKEFIAKALTLLGEGKIMDMMEVADPDVVHVFRTFIGKELASQLKSEFLSTVQTNRSSEEYVFNHLNMGRRAHKNTALAYLASPEEPELMELGPVIVVKLVELLTKIDQCFDKELEKETFIIGWCFRNVVRPLCVRITFILEDKDVLKGRVLLHAQVKWKMVVKAHRFIKARESKHTVSTKPDITKTMSFIICCYYAY